MNTPLIDMDGLTGAAPTTLEKGLPAPTLIEIAGHQVEEYVFPTWAPKVQKLAWVFAPISQAMKEFKTGEGLAAQIRTVPSVIVHVDFQEGELDQAREEVRAAFIEHYQL